MLEQARAADRGWHRETMEAGRQGRRRRVAARLGVRRPAPRARGRPARRERGPGAFRRGRLRRRGARDPRPRGRPLGCRAGRVAGVDELVPGFEPENELERTLIADPELQEGLAWGRPRRGHPEGSVGAHVADLLQTVDRWGETGSAASRPAVPRARPRRAEVPSPRLAAQGGREPPRDARPALRRAIHGRRAAAGDDRAARPPLRAVAEASAHRPGRRAGAAADARADPRPRPVRPVRRARRLHGGQEPGADRMAEDGAGEALGARGAERLSDGQAELLRRRRRPGRRGRGHPCAVERLRASRLAAGVAAGTWPAAPPATMRRTAACAARGWSPAPPSCGSRSGAGARALAGHTAPSAPRRYSPSVENSTTRSSAGPNRCLS